MPREPRRKRRDDNRNRIILAGCFICVRAHLAYNIVNPPMTGRAIPEWVGSSPDAAVPPRVRLRIWEHHNGTCALTGRKIAAGEAWDLDHIRPLSMGGEHREGNLQPVLASAHREKTKQDVANLAKARRLAAKHAGIERKRSRPMPGSKASGWKRKMDGTIVRRD